MTGATDHDLTVDERIAIEHQLIQLNHAFANHIDNGRFEELIALFTEDGVFDRAGLVHRGHQEMREAFSQRPPVTTRHLLSNFYFDSVSRDAATGICYSLTYHAHGVFDGDPLVYGTTHGRLIDMHDQYRRTADGWRLAQRVAVPVLVPEGGP